MSDVGLVARLVAIVARYLFFSCAAAMMPINVLAAFCVAASFKPNNNLTLNSKLGGELVTSTTSAGSDVAARPNRSSPVGGNKGDDTVCSLPRSKQESSSKPLKVSARGNNVSQYPDFYLLYISVLNSLVMLTVPDPS